MCISLSLSALTDDVVWSVAVLLILLPHPSFLIILVRYRLGVLHEPVTFVIHLLVTYALTFLIFSSLIVCVCRDPGPVPLGEDYTDQSEEIDLRHALMSYDIADDDNDDGPGKCFTCQAPKPE
jgi:palmitoyltransferase ZDHHC2/15/20